jgi:hypothetical protein
MLLVRRANGSVMAYPMRGSWFEGRLCSTTYRASAKVRHLLANPAVCCVMRAKHPTVRRRGLALWGDVRFDDVPVEAWIERLTSNRDPDDIATTPEVASRVADRLRTGVRTLLSITPTTASFLEGPHG